MATATSSTMIKTATEADPFLCFFFKTDAPQKVFRQKGLYALPFSDIIPDNNRDYIIFPSPRLYFADDAQNIHPKDTFYFSS
jgi:hypothetical protein